MSMQLSTVLAYKHHQQLIGREKSILFHRPTRLIFSSSDLLLTFYSIITAARMKEANTDCLMLTTDDE